MSAVKHPVAGAQECCNGAREIDVLSAEMRRRCFAAAGAAATSVATELRAPRLPHPPLLIPGHHHPLTLHAGNDTTISVPFTAAQAAQLDAAFKALLNTVRMVVEGTARNGDRRAPLFQRQIKATHTKRTPKPTLEQFAEKAKAERPRRWESMEVRFVAGASSNGNGAAPAGSADAPLELFEAFCNPNAHSSVVDAKVLLTARAAGGGLSVTTEARLSAVRADLDHFLAAVAPGSGGGSSGS